MDEDQRQKLYDEIVDVEQANPNGGGNAFNLYWKALFDYCETPEELLAGQLVITRSYSERNRLSSHFPEFAAVQWPWGDARGLLRGGGRTYFEARLRLRDKLVESARKLIKDHPQENERPSSASPEED